MFSRLQYEVTFPSTGRTLKNDLTLDPGFWAITGPNESGKSFVFEMLRFVLFGSAALRGRADDYATLKATGEFTIKGERYTCIRTIRKATLSRAGETVASSVTAVNAKIVELLGFGIAIFDMAQSINQGEVERLGSMTPIERKRMVDGVLGIEALDIVSRWAMDEARTLDREAEAIRRNLVAPTQPTQPDGYIPSADIDVMGARAAADELSQLEGFLQHDRPQPAAPTCSISLPAENLKGLATKRADLRNQIAQLEAKRDALPAQASYNDQQLNDAEAEWDRYDRWQAAKLWLSQHPEPKYPVTTLRVFRDDWTALRNINARAAIQNRIDDLWTKGSKPCPHCGEEVPLEQDAIERLEKERDALVIAEGVPTPPISSADIEIELERHKSFDQAEFLKMKAVEALDPPVIPRGNIPALRTQIQQAAERASIVQQLEPLRRQFDNMQDFEAMLAQRQAYEDALVVYRTAKTEWDAWKAEKLIKQARANELAGARERAAQAAEAYNVATTYERDLTRFGAEWDTYSARITEADDLEARAAEHRKVRDVMNLLRSLIKQHLIPSLNKVSSHLLSAMTGGQRTAIYVDEDFNVTVDQQGLDTLSGSGKACANLALRIALGQVLTNRVFSVLLADEIDASMDDFRAEQTSNVLYTLRDSISQVLLVSHKSIEATNHIHIGGFSGTTQSSTDGGTAEDL